MNVNPQIVDDMFSTEPEDIRMLTREELFAYRLGWEDMAFKERYTLWRAKRFGMTREEFTDKYSRYIADANKYCVNSGLNSEEAEECWGNFEIKYGLFCKKDCNQ